MKTYFEINGTGTHVYHGNYSKIVSLDKKNNIQSENGIPGVVIYRLLSVQILDNRKNIFSRVPLKFEPRTSKTFLYTLIAF